MRTHRAFPGLQPWSDPSLLRELVTVDALSAVRVEPIVRAREPAALLDVHFAAGERHVTLPLVLVDVAMLLVREADPLVFPRHAAQIVGDEALSPIVDAIAAMLEPLAYRGGRWREELVLVRDDALVQLARGRGWFGAAPLTTSLPRIAPAFYARRFAGGRAICTFGEGAHETAAFVRDLARRCDVAATDTDAAAYFGAGTAPESGPYDLAVGRGAMPLAGAQIVIRSDGEGADAIPIVAPLPANVMLSFDPGDGPVVGHFTIERAPEPFVREAPFSAVSPAIGGSAGRIALVLRPDAAALPDADVDEARALAAALSDEGFSVTLVTRVADAAAFEPDLVHLFGVRNGEHAAAVAAWCTDAHVPLAVHAYYEDPANGGYWGAMVTRYCFGYSADDRNVTEYLGLLAKRAVEVDGVGAQQRFAAPAAALAEAEAVLRDAAVVLVQSERERETVGTLRRGPTYLVPPVAPTYGQPETIGRLVGRESFVLVHGPIESAGNQLLVARAATSLGLPIVLAGPIAEAPYAELVRESAADGVRLIPEPTRGQLAALYRSAAIVADVAWIGRGHARIFEAARCGSAPVLASSRWVDLPIPERWCVDPADIESVARGIGEAWDAYSRHDDALGTVGSAAAASSAAAVRAIVAAYAQIASAG